MWKFHLILAVVLLLGIAGANAQTPKERAIERTGNEHLANELRDACQTAKDPIHCFGVGLSIAGAESGFKQGRTHGYFGMLRPVDKSSYRWVQIYNTKRYKAKDGYFFYGDRGVLPPSRYCTSEHSSNSAVGCPNGRNNFNATWNIYKTIFIDGVKTDESIELQEPTETYIEPVQKGCRRIGTAKEGEKVQVDKHGVKGFIKVLREWIVGKDEKAMVFIC